MRDKKRCCKLDVGVPNPLQPFVVQIRDGAVAAAAVGECGNFQSWIQYRRKRWQVLRDF